MFSILFFSDLLLSQLIEMLSTLALDRAFLGNVRMEGSGHHVCVGVHGAVLKITSCLVCPELVISQSQGECGDISDPAHH